MNTARRPRHTWTESAVLFELATNDEPMGTAQLRAALHPSTYPDPTDHEVLIALRRLALRGRIVAVAGHNGRKKITYWAMPEPAGHGDALVRPRRPHALTPLMGHHVPPCSNPAKTRPDVF